MKVQVLSGHKKIQLPLYYTYIFNILSQNSPLLGLHQTGMTATNAPVRVLIAASHQVMAVCLIVKILVMNRKSNLVPNHPL